MRTKEVIVVALGISLLEGKLPCWLSPKMKPQLHIFEQDDLRILIPKDEEKDITEPVRVSALIVRCLQTLIYAKSRE